MASIVFFYGVANVNCFTVSAHLDLVAQLFSTKSATVLAFSPFLRTVPSPQYTLST